MSRIDFYRNIDNDPNEGIVISISMDEIARIAISKNYGVHRLLSSLVREIRARNEVDNKEYAEKYPDIDTPLRSDDLASGIEDLLNKGLY